MVIVVIGPDESVAFPVDGGGLGFLVVVFVVRVFHQGVGVAHREQVVVLVVCETDVRGGTWIVDEFEADVSTGRILNLEI